MAEPPAPPPATRSRRWARRARRAGLAVAGVLVAWLALAIHPQPLFAYSLQRANVVLHARAPFPAQAGPLLDDVVARLRRSPIYDAGRTHHVFLCDSPTLFALFALPWHRKVGGVTHVHLGGNAFLRPYSIERGRLIGPSGDDKPGERTLAYFIAHEVAHAMTGDHIGRLGYRRLAAFQTEGYADYVAFARPPPFDFASGRAALARDAPEMDVQRSGLYRRYELMVAYLLERGGLTVDQLLAARIDPAATLAAVRADVHP
jgi:hypothetical protein